MISLLLGLGNPGAAYHRTRHNIGFDLIDLLCEQSQAVKRRGRSTASLIEYQAELGDRQIILAKPMTFMNLSGLAAVDLLQQHSLKPADLLVLVDDFSLPLGSLRFRANGTGGGHNGLASLIEQLQTDQFPRLRLGIGPVPPQTDRADFVLSEFAASQLDQVARLLESAAEAVKFAIMNRLEPAMTKYNRPPVLPELE